MRFDKPVRVTVTKAGNAAKLVDNAAQAADILLNHWHGPPGSSKGAKHLAARRAVLAALESASDHAKAERARKAFAAAAEDAGLLMPDNPRPQPIPGFRSPSWRKNAKR